MRLSLAILTLMLFANATCAELTAVRAEQNPEKRAGKAVDHADALTGNLAKTYESDWKATLSAVEEIAESVELAGESLRVSGKNARKSPKYFKKAELRSREILRRLDSFIQSASVDDRAPLEQARARIQQVHDHLLQQIMGAK
jgi:hypothetical protein